VPCPDVECWVSAAVLDGKRESVIPRANLQAVQRREGLKKGFVYLFTVSNVGIAEI
jgi:hypothetical protein